MDEWWQRVNTSWPPCNGAQHNSDESVRLGFLYAIRYTIQSAPRRLLFDSRPFIIWCGKTFPVIVPHSSIVSTKFSYIVSHKFIR